VKVKCIASGDPSDRSVFINSSIYMLILTIMWN
jgi:hypothetical protein